MKHKGLAKKYDLSSKKKIVTYFANFQNVWLRIAFNK